MKLPTLFAFALIAAITIPARAGCTPDNSTNALRVRTRGCKTGDATDIEVRITDKRARGADHAVRVLPKISANYFGADDLPFRIDALNYDIQIAPDAGFGYCCYTAEEHPVAPGSYDCYVEFVANCDKVEWGFTVRADGPRVTFSYERDHPDAFRGVLCRGTGDVADDGANGFGVSDQVHLQIRQGTEKIWDFPIPAATLLEKKSIPVDDPKKYVIATGKDASAIGGSRNTVELFKLKIPTAILVTKQ